MTVPIPLNATTDPSAALVAGTLCLMSCYAQHPLPLYAERVALNLARLAADPLLTPELRTVCRRLGERWEAIGEDACLNGLTGAVSEDRRPLH